VMKRVAWLVACIYKINIKVERCMGRHGFWANSSSGLFFYCITWFVPSSAVTLINYHFPSKWIFGSTFFQSAHLQIHNLLVHLFTCSLATS
jgi:hypothetical protein